MNSSPPSQNFINTEKLPKVQTDADLEIQSVVQVGSSQNCKNKRKRVSDSSRMNESHFEIQSRDKVSSLQYNSQKWIFSKNQSCKQAAEAIH